mgnify:CR=1 FL=1
MFFLSIFGSVKLNTISLLGFCLLRKTKHKQSMDAPKDASEVFASTLTKYKNSYGVSPF